MRARCLILWGFVTAGGAATVSADASIPAHDHVFVIVMENKDYDQVRTAPYTASLIASGAVLTSSYAVTHPSQPNYLALWAGTQGGVVDNTCPAPGSPFTHENLGHALESAGSTWRAYSENLPDAGSPVCDWDAPLYARRHEPWTNFDNLDHANERPWSDLAADLAAHTLPHLAFLIPNNCHNTHDCGIGVGDAWLATVVPDLIAGAGPNGLVIVTWDEDSSLPGNGNHILTVFAGPWVKAGFASPGVVTHYDVLRTLCDVLGIPPFANAATASTITDLWVDATVGVPAPRPPRASLSVPAPSPSRGEVTAVLNLEGPTRYEAHVYDLEGRRLRTLDRGLGSGAVALRWDGRNEDGRPAAGGVYVVVVRTGAGTLTRKAILVR